MSKKAIAHLRKDPLMSKVIDSTEEHEGYRSETVFAGLLRSIVSQQLSVQSAASIHARFLALFDAGFPEPGTLLQIELETLRSCGLSRPKVKYIFNVAEYFVQENLWPETDWQLKNDEEIIALLTKIKGVGKWTVQMILMFTLKRTDVFPVDDLGIQQAMIKLYDLDGNYATNASGKRALYAKLHELSDPWRPHRSLACKYLWRWRG